MSDNHKPSYHHQSHNHAHDHHSGNISTAFWLNTAFACIELVGGVLTNSVAILSDALHDFGDSLSLATSWYFQRKSNKKRDAVFTYGYKRFSLLGALVNSIVLLIGSIFIIRESVERLFAPQQPDAKGMLILAFIGIAVNGAAMLRLRKGNTINERVVSLHFLEDVLGWVAVLIGSVIMMFANVPILDPILSIGIAVFILFNVYRNIRSSLQIILQGVPEQLSEKEIKILLSTFPEIRDVHDVHVWTMDGNYHVLTMHVVIANSMNMSDSEALKMKIKTLLKEAHINHATIELETESVACEHFED